ncbi:polymer-forming cytoskeletal protein [Leeuwenhoekiella sp. A16]|uniref:bactofilin family protein n=1 Tax=unclassified Leeuwenhoekiella TaxID=2615029 RepID=UPI003A8062B8|tara:strand:- start:348 stop:749 length:402 start_codon:yes stop_codon:yes gene_type:complete
MKRDRNLETDPNNKQNRISQGTKIVGNITSEGGFRIDGIIEGEINASGKVVLGAAGKIKGTLTCNDADIEGTVDGILKVSNLLSLKSSAHLEGEVTTGKLAVEPGARFNASCVMQGAVKALDKNGRKETEKSA